MESAHALSSCVGGRFEIERRCVLSRGLMTSFAEVRRRAWTVATEVSRSLLFMLSLSTRCVDLCYLSPFSWDFFLIVNLLSHHSDAEHLLSQQ